ncbi:unnamed protein product [Lactuca virosa]|uniref:Uncharacterized protein n=1 Tax=Lactuca virosa TaxID=75947 RepID=A0AAU9NA34_9ASTR|nr:unnamed protein product [Lactuca virosa]
MPECPTQHLFGDDEIWEHYGGGRKKTNENLPDVIRPSYKNTRRRALSNINKNIIRAPPTYPYAANGLPGVKSQNSKLSLMRLTLKT